MGSSERSSSSKEAWYEVADRRPGRCPAGRWIVPRRRGADTLESHRSGLHGAARPRSHGDASVGHGGRGVLQRPGVPGEDRSPRQDRAVAGRALARDRPEELHLLPQARGALPQRTRAQSRRREVRDRARHEPGDEASVSAVLRVHRRHHRQGRLHHHVRAEEPQRELPDQPRPPGLGDLPERGGGHPQERADRDRALQDGRVGARRPHRAGEEPRLPRAAMAALKAGDVDASLFGLGPEHVTDLKNDDRFTVIVGDTTNDVVMAMNNSLKPFTDVRVRRAVTHAVDRPEVLKGAMFGMGRVLGSNVDPLNPYFVDLANAMPYDVARARRLLAEAGYPNGFETTLKVTPMYNYTVRAGEIITSQLAKAGVKVRIEQIEWTQWLARVWREADYDMTIIGHAEAWDIGNYANRRYYFRYDNLKFQEIFKQSEETLDDRARRKLYVQMQRMLVDDAPAVFLFMH